MKINHLELNGTISMYGNKEFDYDDFFDKLEELGYRFGGSYTPYSFELINEEIQDIVSSLTKEQLLRMIEIHDNHYGENSGSNFEEFLLTNFGTGIYQKVFLDTLDDEMIPKFNKYSNSNWQVSDIFEGDLPEAVVKKMKELGLI